MVDAGGRAEGKGAGPGGDEPLRVGVRDRGVAPVRPRPVVVELAHPPPFRAQRALELGFMRSVSHGGKGSGGSRGGGVTCWAFVAGGHGHDDDVRRGTWRRAAARGGSRERERD